MLPDNHLLQLVPLRVESAIRRLQGGIWTKRQSLPVKATGPGPQLLSWKEASRKALHPAMEGSFWGKLFDQRWCRIVLSAKTRGDEWFHWKDQGEATLYLNGNPWFGFDVAHRYCRLPAGIKELWVESNCVQSAIWHHEASGLSARGSLFEGASLCYREEEAWNAFHDLKCLFETALLLRRQENPELLPQVSPGCVQPPVEKHSPLFRRMLRLMDDAVDVLDNEGIPAARQRMKEIYRELKQNEPFMQCVLTGHAHIDLVWLWPERIGELKAVHTFSTVDRLMDEYPEFRFAYSQPASYEAVGRRSPELLQRVKKRMRTRQWQATGAMYVESDTLIACGEALLRSFLVGQESFRELRGAPVELTWLPDVFGYSACLPQMMNLTGVKSFFTTKMTWNMVNRFPYSSFVWRGNDGSEVTAHVTQDCGYNSQTEVAELKASSWGHQQADVHPEYLLPTGYGDGGGGPTAEMCERARRLDSLPGLPGLKWGQPEDFFVRLEKLKKRLPVYQGECYLEGHRGTYTTHGELKATFRGLEKALQISEAVSSVTGRRWDRTHAWKRLIFSQFHDYIPGSSVRDVYLEGLPELQKIASEEKQQTLRALQKGKRTPSLFNPHAVSVQRWIKDPETRKEVRVSLPPLSGISLRNAEVTMESAVRIKTGIVSNGLAEFRLDENGWINHLVFQDHAVPLKGPAGQLMLYHDQPARFEAWDLDRQTLAFGKPCDAKAVIRSFREGEHRAGFRVKRKIGARSSAEVLFYLEAGNPLLQVRVDLDWQEPHALLKLLFPTEYGATNARFGIPYSSVLRSQVVNGPVSEAMWEVPFSRWLAIFDERESQGLFAVTESKYGTSVREGSVGISLVRSPLHVGRDDRGAAWPPHLSRVPAFPRHTDIGSHSIRMVWGRYHQGLSREEHPASLADTLFTEPLFYEGSAIASPLEKLSGAETLIPAWAVPVDADSFLLRFHEVAGQRGTVQVQAATGWKVSPCDTQGQALAAGKAQTGIIFKPYQIVSVLFKKLSGKS